MPKLYPGGITIGTNLKIQQPNPVADYMVVSAKTDLTDTAILPNQFTGMTTFVVEDQNTYVLKNTGWQILGGGSTFTGGTVSGATVFTNSLSANTISATTISASTYYGLPADIYVTSGNIDRDANLINLNRSSGDTVQITNLVTVIEKSRDDIWSSLIPTSSLVKGATYKVVNCDSSLYDNRNGDTFTTVYLNAIENDVLSDTGIGVFYTPKYINDNGWEIWSPLSILQVTDIVGVFKPDEPITGNIYGSTGIIFGDITSQLFYIVSGNWSGESAIIGDVSGAQANISLITIKQYNYDDVVFWGGTAWFVTDTFSSVAAVAVDIFNLDSATYPIIQKLPLNDDNIQYYNISYDEVKYDIANDRITYRKDKNNNIVSTTTDNITYWLGNGKYNPIKAFKWGHDFTASTTNGIGNQKIVNSYNENINFRGTSQYNIEMDTLSYQTNIYGEGNDTNQFNIYLSNSYQDNIKIVNTAYQKNVRLDNQSYQTNLNILSGSTQERVNFENQSYQSGVTITTTSNQKDIVFENKASQYNVKFTGSSYQERVKFYNFSFNRGFNSVNEVDKIYTNTLLTDNSAPQVIGIKNNELVEVDVSSIGSPITVVSINNLFSTALEAGNGSNVSYSNFFGYQSGYQVTDTTDSNFFGYQSGYQVTDTDYSNFFGKWAGYGASGSSYSNFFGYQSGYGGYNSTNSNFIGNGAGLFAYYTVQSNFIGNEAGRNASGVNQSNFFGTQSGFGANSNYSNFFGYQSGKSFGSNYVGSNNIIIGTNISLPNGVTNSINLGGVLFGTGTYSATTGNPSITGQTNGRIGINVVTPLQALHVSGGTLINGGLTATTISATTYNGYVPLSATPITVVSGSSLFSTAFTGTGLNASAVTNSIFFGVDAGRGAQFSIGSNFIGQNAGNGATSANDSNFFGGDAGNAASGASGSNFFNFQAGRGARDATSSNFFGGNAGYFAIGASNSNFFGNSTGYQATGATNSNFFGTQAGYTARNASYSNLFGYYVGKSFTNNDIGSNNIIIGTNISLPSGATNSINIGGVLFGTGTYSALSVNPSITGQTNGRIGIGVVNPTQTLHVSGNTFLEGFLIVSGTTAAIGGSNAGSLLNLQQTWNTTGAPTAVKLNVTDTASASASLLMDLQVTGNSKFSVAKDGAVFAANGFRQNVYQADSTNSGINLRFNGSNQLISYGVSIENAGVSNQYLATGGTFNYLELSSTTFNPTIGNAVFNGYFFGSRINQTGTASGVTRGLFIDPILTSAADFRAIETTNGMVIFSDSYEASGTTSGSLLDLRQTWNTSGTPTSIKLNVTDTASNTNSLLMDLQVTGSSKFSVNKNGGISATTYNGYVPADMRTDLTNRRLGYTVSTDFLSTFTAALAPFSFATVASGTFAVVSSQIDSQHPGVQQMLSFTGVTNSGGYITSHAATNAFSTVFTDGLQTDLIFKLPATTTNNYIRFGYQYGSLAITAPTSGNYFEITGTTLVGITRSGGAQSATSSFTLTASTWYHARVKESVVGATTGVTFTIYDMDGTTLYNQSSTTNINLATTRGVTVFGVNTVSNAATTAIIYLDYLGVTFPPMIRGALD